MIYLFLFLLLIFLFPYLLIPLLLPLILIFSFKFTVNAIITLIYAKAQLLRIATNKRLWQNHALEHATINIIEEVYGPQRISGLAKEDRFFILGPIPPRLVEEAVKEALRRLKGGAWELVVHRNCGSSLVVGHLVAALTFFILLFSTNSFGPMNVLLALVVSSLIGPPLGRLSQLYCTTSNKVHNMSIVRVYPGYGKGLIGLMNVSNRVFIATRGI